MASYATNLTQLYANGENPNIIGRDTEMRLMMLAMLRNEKPNVLLVAQPGVGKTALVHQLAYLIANDLAPTFLKGFKVVEINTNALIAGPGYRGVTEDKFQQVIDTSLNSGKTILFFDEFHTVQSLGQMANGQTPGLGNTLKPYMTRPDFRIIGATTSEEFKLITDTALLRRMFVIKIGEPTEEATKHIIALCFAKYSNGIKIKKECINLVYDLSLTADGNNPDKAKDITDLVCANARMEGISEITTQFVEDSFEELYKRSKKIEVAQFDKEDIFT